MKYSFPEGSLYFPVCFIMAQSFEMMNSVDARAPPAAPGSAPPPANTPILFKLKRNKIILMNQNKCILYKV